MNAAATAAPPHPFTRRDAFWLAALAASFVATRVAWLRWNPGSGSYWEEAYRWIAVELWEAGTFPSFLLLQADDYQGGSLLMIALAALPLRALGASVFALKLTAVGFSTLTLAALFETVRRFFGRRAAVIASGAYIAGPPLVAYWGLTVMGSHGESVLWSLVQLSIFLGILSGAWRRPAAFLAFGLISGLGLWFCFTTGLSLVACAVTWCLLERPPRPRELAAAALGAVVGLLPWLAYNASNDFVGIQRVLQLFGLAPQVDPWPAQTLGEKARELVVNVLPTALLDPTHSAEAQGQPSAIPLAFAAVTLPALALAFERVVTGLRARGERAAERRARATRAGVAGVPADLLRRLPRVALCRRRAGTLGYRIFTPFAVFLCIPVSITLAEFIGQGGAAAWAGRLACAAWLASLAAATGYFASREPDGNSPVTLRGGYRTLGVLLHRKHAPEVEPTLAVARALPEQKVDVLFGLGWGMQNRQEMGEPLAELEQALLSIPEPEQTDVFKGIYWTVQVRRGTLLALRRNYADTPQLRKQQERVQELSDFIARLRPGREPDSLRPSHSSGGST